MQKAHQHEAPKRALLRYFGGKWSIAPWVIRHLPEHRVYIEPFGGAASVLLRKPRSKVEVYNDLDAEIVGLFRVVQDPVLCQQLFRLLRRTPYARAEFVRAFQPCDDPVERSRRAIVRAYLSFHHESLFNLRKTTFADARHRGGSSSKAREWMGYPRALAQICRRLRGVVIDSQEAMQVIEVQDTADALFFVDPPYLPATRSKSGYRHEMDTTGHVALLDRLCQVKARVVLAGYPSPLYDAMLTGWQRVERKAIAAGSTRARTEVLWIK